MGTRIIKQVNSKAEAVGHGFAGYNNGQHVLVDGTKFETAFPTVSIKVSETVFITVCLLPVSKGPHHVWVQEDGHRAAEVAVHSDGEIKMNCCVLGKGPTYYNSFKEPDAPTVVTVFPKK